MKSKNAFTLVELAIVLVIIGLLVAGVLTGQTLIETSRRQSIYKEYQGYLAAFNTFYLKYNTLPGDIKNATNFFSGVNNGNGNKLVEGYSESSYAWQHLSKAGLIKGEYNGLASCGGDSTTEPWDDAPGTAWNNVAVWMPFSWSYADHGYSAPTLEPIRSLNKNILYFGRNMCSGSWNDAAQINCQNAYMLDEKYDDGFPYKGNMKVLWECFTSYDVQTSIYTQIDTSTKTVIKFDIGL